MSTVFLSSSSVPKQLSTESLFQVQTEEVAAKCKVGTAKSFQKKFNIFSLVWPQFVVYEVSRDNIVNSGVQYEEILQPAH